MGIHGIYKEIGPGKRIALSKLALEKFEETGRPLRIAIDTSIWLFQIQASKGGSNPALRTFYYRLLRLIALSIHPIFVFDGPNKPPFKRNKRTGPNVASIPEFLAKQLLKQFGYPIHLAPGEAEAECALLQREGIVDAVLSEDVDTLMFGSGVTIRNWSPESSSKTPTHVNVYNAIETKNGPSGLDREGMILVALMSGGDYVPEGIPGCGPKTACEAAKAGFGRDLCRIPRNDSRAMREWRDRLQHELKTNESKIFKRRHTTLKIPDDFPRVDILGYYTHPAISSQRGLDKLRQSINWDQELDYPGLRDFTKDAFDWTKLEGAKHFVRSLAPCMVVRQLRLRSQQMDQLPTDDLQAIQEDESLLIKSIHGKRQHPVTDNCTELRVAFTPIQLVNIDLSMEEPDEDPDEVPSSLQQGDVDLDDEVALDLDDDAPKKRGPTKFDPQKPARIWVLESFVKIGVPLKVQDWEAERQTKQKPRRAAATQAPASSTTKSITRRQKPSGDVSQAPIRQFARVTKPGARLANSLAKTQDRPTEKAAPSTRPPLPSTIEILDLVDTSPVQPRTRAPLPRPARETSAPIVELPPSVTKRRRRGPIQRAHTLPTNPSAISGRSTPPQLLDTVETLDLLSSPVLPFPSQLPAKKSKTHEKKIPLVRAFRGSSVTSSPGQGRQTTLDAWRASATPKKPREDELRNIGDPIPTPPGLQPSHVVDELDLTLSSPSSPRLLSDKVNPNVKPRGNGKGEAQRPPLSSVTCNKMRTCTGSSSSSSSKPASITRVEKSTNRRTSPRLSRSKSASPELDTLDLTTPEPKPVSGTTNVTNFTVNADVLDLTLSPSPPPQRNPTGAPHSQVHHPAPQSPSPTQPLPPTLRRSPRTHTSPSPTAAESKISPPAAWKTREKKKRQIILRQSVAGAWDFVDVENDLHNPEEVPKGKDRRKWRESEVEVLDLS